MSSIGHVRTGYRTVADTPVQTGLNRDATGVVVIDPQFVAGLDGLARFDFAWVLTFLHLDRAEPDPIDALRPTPFLAVGPSLQVGVFATRYPVRPNPIGLSLVRIEHVEGNEISFTGVDLTDGTPVLDIKPWVPNFDLPHDGLVDRAGDVAIGWYSDSLLDRRESPDLPPSP